jgi:2-keto-4-pentenoate hydratase/2-oxohepta-3-ene-1,7-dioic acid hydratase in catechol pathway
MLEARFSHGGEVHEGVVEDGTIVADEDEFAPDEVDLLAPCEPTKVVGIGRNYAEPGEDVEVDVPLLFFKPPSSVVGDGDGIEPPPESAVKYEGELGAVVGERCRSVDAEEAMEYIAGYTCVNDVTAPDWADRENQWVRSKGADTLCPTGPYLRTDVGDADPELDVETRVNGELRQSSNTRHMILSVSELVAEASRYVTLEPGDLLATGTPTGMATVEPGDVIEVTVEAVGTLTNEVV